MSSRSRGRTQSGRCLHSSTRSTHAARTPRTLTSSTDVSSCRRPSRTSASTSCSKGTTTVRPQLLPQQRRQGQPCGRGGRRLSHGRPRRSAVRNIELGVRLEVLHSAAAGLPWLSVSNQEYVRNYTAVEITDKAITVKTLRSEANDIDKPVNSVVDQVTLTAEKK
jgi:hypothetical protein